MEYGQFICTIIFYLILCIRFRKGSLCYVYVKNFSHLLTFDSHSDFFQLSQFAGTTDLNYKHGNILQFLKVVFKVLSRPLFLRNLSICLFFCNLNQVQIISETKLNHVNTKATRGITVSEIDKNIVSFFFNDKGLKLSLRN